MNKYKFDKTKKNTILAGRSITYVSREILGRQKGYITNILNGKLACSKVLAYFIATKLDKEATSENDYFTEVKEGK